MEDTEPRHRKTDDPGTLRPPEVVQSCGPSHQHTPELPIGARMTAPDRAIWRALSPVRLGGTLGLRSFVLIGAK